MHNLISRGRLGWIVLLAFLVVPPLAGRQAPAPIDVVAKVRAQVAPDTRLAVFDVKLAPKGDQLDVSGEVDQAASRDAVLTALRSAGYRAVDKITVLPEPALADRTSGIVTVSVANMKSTAGHAAEMANQLLMGAEVRVLKKDGTWYLVQSVSDRYLGWVERDHLAIVTPEDADAFRGGKHFVVTTVYATVHEQATEESGVVSDAVMGDVLRLRGLSGGWYSVQLPDGRPGFVQATAGSDYEGWRVTRRLTPENIERTARLFVGVPYMWGGTSPKAFDCSGFTKTVFRANGFELQRDADQQSSQGDPVATDNDLRDLRKGDLLFFGPRPGVTRITHVGIYLGDRRFIHCSGMVRFNSFDPASPIYSENLLKRLVKVRRMTGGRG